MQIILCYNSQEEARKVHDWALSSLRGLTFGLSIGGDATQTIITFSSNNGEQMELIEVAIDKAVNEGAIPSYTYPS